MNRVQQRLSQRVLVAARHRASILKRDGYDDDWIRRHIIWNYPVDNYLQTNHIDLDAFLEHVMFESDRGQARKTMSSPD